MLYRNLRISPIGHPLINLCSALLLLNFSYIASLVSAFNPRTNTGGCGFLAALFHYLFLTGSFAFAVLVTFVLTNRTQWSWKKNIIFNITSLLLCWGR